MESSETSPSRAGRPPSPVRDARKALKLRQVDVAEAIGVATSYVCMIESGYVPKLEIRVALAQVLRRTPQQLWSEVTS